MLPVSFIEALRNQDEVIVSSREAGRVRSVRAWYVLAPDGRIYLFTYSFALRAARWRKDPWVRLTVPGGPSVDGTAHFLTEDELDGRVTPLIMERWWMWGATTEEGLRRMLRDRSHVLVRVDIS
ncbi:MAG TPA: hypothetical protein VIT43_01595 [Candidatus Dormibacteraeota bacterium]